MSVSLPRYVAGPVARNGRGGRIVTIWLHELRARAGWGTWLVLGLIWAAVLLIVLFTSIASSALGDLTLSSFYAPYVSPVWPFFLLIIATAVSAGAISEDLGNRSITLFLCRPILSSDYLAAKSAAVGFWIGIGAILPGIVGVVLAAGLGYVGGPLAARAIGAFLSVGLLTTVFFTAVGIFFSSITKRSLYAGAGIFGTVLVADIVASAIGGVTGNSEILYLSPFVDLGSASQAAFAVPGTAATEPAASVLLLVGTAIVLFLLAAIRLTRVEVVGE